MSWLRRVAFVAAPLAGAVVLREEGDGVKLASPHKVPSYTLNDGYTIPAIGFGTYRINPGNDTYHAVTIALGHGYRHFDTAEMYSNEADVGRAIRDFMAKTGTPRSEIKVETKIWDTEHGYNRTISAGLYSHSQLGLDYIDILILHSPHGKIVESYYGLLALKQMGVVKSVGVSNFGLTHLRALADYCLPAPVVNQFELHPLNFNSRQDVVQYCAEHGILVQPYGSVLSGHAELLAKGDAIAAKHGKTAAQVMLRWALEQGFQIIPKSVHAHRIKENIDVFDFHLNNAEIATLNKAKGELNEYWAPLWDKLDVGDVGPAPKTCDGNSSTSLSAQNESSLSTTASPMSNVTVNESFDNSHSATLFSVRPMACVVTILSVVWNCF